MKKLIMNKLGPIDRCELECTKFMALTGFQTSGKSNQNYENIIELAKIQALISNIVQFSVFAQLYNKI